MEAVIIGAGKLAAEAARILKKQNSVDLIGFLDDNPEMAGASIEGLKVIGEISDLERFRRFGVEGICIASSNGDERIRLAGIAEKAGYFVLTVRSGACSVSCDAHLGRGCIVLDGASIGSGAVVEDCCLIGKGVEIEGYAIIPPGSSLFRNRITGANDNSNKIAAGEASEQEASFFRGGANSR